MTVPVKSATVFGMRGVRAFLACSCAAMVCAAAAACASDHVVQVEGDAPDAIPDEEPDASPDAPTQPAYDASDASEDVVLRVRHACGPGAAPPDGGVCFGTQCSEQKFVFVEPAGMAVLHANVNGKNYTIGYISASSTVSRCWLPDCGSDPEQLYASPSSTITSIAVSAAGLYWVAGNTDIWTSDHLGRNAHAIANNPSHFISLNGMAVAGGKLFWNDVSGPIFSCDAADCEATKKQLDLSNAQGLTASSTHIYWSGPNDGTLSSAALDGSGYAVIASGIDPVPVGVAVDDCHLYWWARSDAPTIMRCSLADCQHTQQVIASIGRTIVIGAIAVDDQRVYLLDRDGEGMIAVLKP